MIKRSSWSSCRRLTLGLWLAFFIAGCTFPEREIPPEEGEQLFSYEELTGSDIDAGFLAGVMTAFSPEDFGDQRIQRLMRYPVRVYRVIFKTTYKGVIRRASGAVVIPRVDGPLSVISYQHGAMLADQTVPSRFRDVFSMDPEMGLMQVMGTTGFITAGADYLGYGESGELQHPFQHAGSLAQCCMDLLRAVRELCTRLKVKYKNEYWLMGYSEGGFATLALQREMETKFSGEFPLKGVSAGAGAYDLAGTASWMMMRREVRSPTNVCLLLTGYNEAYGWGRDLAEIFREPYLSRIRDGLLGGNYTIREAEALLSPFLEELLTGSFIRAYRGEGETGYKNAFAENSLHMGWLPGAPLRLFHGTADMTVPDFNTERAWLNFIEQGAKAVHYIPLQGRDHGTGIFPWVKDTLLWFAGGR